MFHSTVARLVGFDDGGAYRTKGREERERRRQGSDAPRPAYTLSRSVPTV